LGYNSVIDPVLRFNFIELILHSEGFVRVVGKIEFTLNRKQALTMNRRFNLVDVFHDGPFSGNPLAVVLDADGLTTDQMQTVTRWMNLSETAFLLPPTEPTADYRVRIFTLEREMPFAGHPTLGSAHAWLTAGGQPKNDRKIIQECKLGLVELHQRSSTFSFAAPPLIRSGNVEEQKIDEVIRFLHIERSEVIDIQWRDNGPGWIGVLLKSSDAVLALEPPRAYPTRIDVGVIGAYPPNSSAAFEIRTFFSDHNQGIVEDPVTGSFNASAAQWLLSAGHAIAPYIVSQGTRLGRAGRIYIEQDSNSVVWVGGKTTTMVSGTCTI